MADLAPVFDAIAWLDPLTGTPLEPVVSARTPAGVPISGCLRVQGTNTGYPIVDCVARLTPELAARHARWLVPFGVHPATPAPGQNALQPEHTVASFGWQWNWSREMRTEVDLRMRVAERFGLAPESFGGLAALDAGAGAGDQSRYLVNHGARVISVDLSAAIDIVASKLRMEPRWFGVQADVTALPFADAQFDVIYCEGVIQHTRDSMAAVRELVRVVRSGGRVLATHYVRYPPQSRLHHLRRALSSRYYDFLRRRLVGLPREHLLLATGILAALSYVPGVGWALAKSGTAIRHDLMPDFKTTWTNTFDYYGQHSFQRFATPDEFFEYFDALGTVDLALRRPGVVVAVKR